MLLGCLVRVWAGGRLLGVVDPRFVVVVAAVSEVPDVGMYWLMILICRVSILYSQV
jgi:hypothetical protein